MEMTKGMQKVIGRAILDLSMPTNDAYAPTVREYLRKLLRSVWIDGEGFDGKRPFGNSGWHREIYGVLVEKEFIDGDADGDPYDDELANELVMLAIDAL